MWMVSLLPYAVQCHWISGAKYNIFPGFDTIVANYGTDIPHLEGNHTRYLYGPGTILVAHGDNEALTVGDLEDAVEGFQKLILHSLKL